MARATPLLPERWLPYMRGTSLLVLVVASMLVLASGAQAASRLVIRGAGFGHGVGMSQYGAYGYAQHGYGYSFILSHYYTGTSLSVLDSNPNVRVLLQSGRSSVTVTGVAEVGNQPLDVTQGYTIVRGGDGLIIKQGKKKLFTSAPPMTVSAAAGSALELMGVSSPGVRDGLYRGALQVSPGAGKGLTVVNSLDLEDYVRGVVSGESPASWPAEALRAQAVTARTYAVTTSKPDGPFDQYADTRSQVYKGALAEYPSTDAAVAATRGQVVTYQGQPITTYFFSTSGGETENIENSFIGAQPEPWLKGVDDPYDTASPEHRWGPFNLTFKQAQAKLGRLLKGSFKKIKALARGVSPRIVQAQIVGSRGVTTVSGPQLRSIFGLDDTWAYFTSVTSTVKKPKKPATPATPVPGAPPTGGTSPGGLAAAASARSAVVLTGSIDPGKRGAWATVQVQTPSGWQTATDMVLGRHGTYRVSLAGPGVYRVVYRAVVGPNVSVR